MEAANFSSQLIAIRQCLASHIVVSLSRVFALQYPEDCAVGQYAESVNSPKRPLPKPVSSVFGAHVAAGWVAYCSALLHEIECRYIFVRQSRKDSYMVPLRLYRVFAPVVLFVMLAIAAASLWFGPRTLAVRAQDAPSNSVFLPSVLDDSAEQMAPTQDSLRPGPLDSADTGLVIDHTSVALFDQIPDQYLTSARNLHMLFSDRSVGQNINEALDCLTATNWASAPASCRSDYYDANWNSRVFTQVDLDAGQVPARILFDPDPVTYSRANWTFEFRGR